MYTQCIKCETVFRLSAEVLRAAGGQVRCGRCGEVFNALARLAEDPSAFPAAESAIDLETRANEILESTVPPMKKPGESPTTNDDIIEIEDFDSHEVDFARLQVVEKFVEDYESNAQVPSPAPAPAPVPAPAPRTAPPPGSAAAPQSSPPPAAKPAAGAPAPKAIKAAPVAAPAPAAAPAAAPAMTSPAAPRKVPAAGVAGKAPTAMRADEDSVGDGSMEFTLPPGELDRVFIESSTPGRPPFGAKADPNDVAPAGEASHGPGSPANLGGGLVSESARLEMLAGVAQPELAEIPQAPQRTIPFNVWLGAAVFLALLLCAQWIHGNREWFATHAPLRGSLHGLYAALGVAVAAPANLSAYQLRQWGVTGDPSASGTLRVRASILNTAAQLQPYPLLRVTLANRFGAKIGMRDFEPAEYMGKPVARMLAPGERADATLDIVDPGKDAEGFEIDVCVRGVEQKISCAGDVAAHAKQPHAGS